MKKLFKGNGELPRMESRSFFTSASSQGPPEDSIICSSNRAQDGNSGFARRTRPSKPRARC